MYMIHKSYALYYNCDICISVCMCVTCEHGRIRCFQIAAVFAHYQTHVRF